MPPVHITAFTVWNCKCEEISMEANTGKIESRMEKKTLVRTD
jgi:hypothetical protein